MSARRAGRPDPASTGHQADPLSGSLRLTMRPYRSDRVSNLEMDRALFQLAAFLINSAISFSPAGVSFVMANATGHNSSSSSLASGWKPNVE